MRVPQKPLVIGVIVGVAALATSACGGSSRVAPARPPQTRLQLALKLVTDCLVRSRVNFALGHPPLGQPVDGQYLALYGPVLVGTFPQPIGMISIFPSPGQAVRATHLDNKRLAATGGASQGGIIEISGLSKLSPSILRRVRRCTAITAG